ncbi:MAG: flagellar basal body-associated FliL family protein [Pseudomonadota bacterium]
MAKDKKDQTEEQDQQPKTKKGLSMKWIIIISIVLLIVAAGAVAGYYFFSKTQSKKPPEQKPAVVTIWPMEAFVVNISDAGGERYLKLVIQLDLSEPNAVAELEQIKPRLRDSIIDLLTPKTYKELMDLAGKQRLREDIAGRVNNALTKGKVTRVYFTEFVVQ